MPRSKHELSVRALKGPCPSAYPFQASIQKILLGQLHAIPSAYEGPQPASASNVKDDISWIWYTFGEKDANNPEDIKASLRAEWCKSRARARRSREEVILVDEEMRRAIEYCRWKGDWWLKQIGNRQGVAPWIEEGLRSYALEQASTEMRRMVEWTQRLKPIRDRAVGLLQWINDPEFQLDGYLAQLASNDINIDLSPDVEDSFMDCSS
ncbi:hypothetical protein VNI00_016080 [Paramarasmius palmivorus]|uniref:Uncharacterized protein n=1 Tax=Paramarasmius palmivorus TaxID=297713 RepID=A0AAW0BGC5_9AGAR